MMPTNRPGPAMRSGTSIVLVVLLLLILAAAAFQLLQASGS